MDYVKLLYWITMAENAKSLFVTMIVIFTIMAVFSFIAYIVCLIDAPDSEKLISRWKSWIKWSVPLMIFSWSLYIITPDKKDAILIVVGGYTMNYLTSDEGKKLPKELENFLVTEIRLLAKEAQIELTTLGKKEQVLDEIKNLSGEQLLKKLKTNPELKNLLLK